MVIMKAVGVLARLGLDNAAKKYIPVHIKKKEAKKLNGTILLCLAIPILFGFGLASVLYLSFPIVENFVREEFRSTITLFLAGIPLFATMMVGMAATQGFKETKYTVYIRDLGQSGGAVLLVGIGVFVFHDISIAISGYLVSLLVGTILAVVFILRQNRFNWKAHPEFQFHEIFTYSFPLVAIAVVQYLISWTDVLMLGSFVQSAQVGWYQAAFQTSVLLIIVLQSANTLFPSVAADLYHSGRHEQLNQVYTAVTKWISYLTVLGFLFLFVYASDILSIFGTVTPSAKHALLILGFGQTFAAVIGPAGYLLSMVERERVELVNTITVLVINISLNYVLIQQFGIVGAAIATGISLALLNVFRIFEVWYLLRILPYSRTYWKGAVAIILATIVMVLGQAVNMPSIFKILTVGMISIITFFISVMALGIDDSDRLLLESIQKE